MVFDVHIFFNILAPSHTLDKHSDENENGNEWMPFWDWFFVRKMFFWNSILDCTNKKDRYIQNCPIFLWLLNTYFFFKNTVISTKPCFQIRAFDLIIIFCFELKLWNNNIQTFGLSVLIYTFGLSSLSPSFRYRKSFWEGLAYVIRPRE